MLRRQVSTRYYFYSCLRTIYGAIGQKDFNKRCAAWFWGQNETLLRSTCKASRKRGEFGLFPKNHV